MSGIAWNIAVPFYFHWISGEIASDREYSYGCATQYSDINPVTQLDYLDLDIIRVEYTYHMVSTNMHFMPGCEILRSYDLRRWEYLFYVYDFDMSGCAIDDKAKIILLNDRVGNKGVIVSSQ